MSLTQQFSQNNLQDNKPQTFSVELITSQRQLGSLWNTAFKEIFTDKNDREPLSQLTDRFRNGENFFVLKDDKGDVQGISLPQILLNDASRSDSLPPQASFQDAFRASHDSPSDKIALKPMYVPWVGVKEGVRNTGVGTHFDQSIADLMREKYGVTHTLLDIEDPTRLHNSGYSKEELPEAIENAERRINYWKRQGFLVVTDERLNYVRPSSENDQDIQAYDHMAVRFENDDVRQRYMSEDGSKISIEFVRQSYLDMTRIQYGNFSEMELRRLYPAVQSYLTNLDEVLKHDQWLSIDTSAIIPKVTPNIPVEINSVAANQNHPNAGASMNTNMSSSRHVT